MDKYEVWVNDEFIYTCESYYEAQHYCVYKMNMCVVNSTFEICFNGDVIETMSVTVE